MSTALTEPTTEQSPAASSSSSIPAAIPASSSSPSPSPPPPPYLSPLTLTSWTRILSVVNSRDRLFRLIQYFARFVRCLPELEAFTGVLSWSTEGKKRYELISAKLLGLETALGSSRQTWRLFKSLNVLQKHVSGVVVMAPAAMKINASDGSLTNMKTCEVGEHQPISNSRTIIAKRSSGLQILDGLLALLSSSFPPLLLLKELLKLLADFGLFMWFLLDNVTFLYKHAVLRGDPKQAQKTAARFWVTSSLCNAILQMHDLVIATLHLMRFTMAQSKDGRDGDNSECRKLKRAQMNQLYATLVKNLQGFVKFAADTVISYSLTRDQPLHGVLTGGLGVISSTIGLVELWPRKEKTN